MCVYIRIRKLQKDAQETGNGGLPAVGGVNVGGMGRKQVELETGMREGDFTPNSFS